MRLTYLIERSTLRMAPAYPIWVKCTPEKSNLEYVYHKIDGPLALEYMKIARNFKLGGKSPSGDRRIYASEYMKAGRGSTGTPENGIELRPCGWALRSGSPMLPLRSF